MRINQQGKWIKIIYLKILRYPDMRLVRKIFLFVFCTHLFIVFFGLVIGPFLPFEFSNPDMSRFFLDFYCLLGTPIAFFISLGWSMRSEFSWWFNIFIVLLTSFLATGTHVLIIVLAIVFQYGRWTDEVILARNKNNQKHIIKTQIISNGALGDEVSRTVEAKPFLYFWNYIQEFDKNKIDSYNWVITNEILIKRGG